MPGDATPEGARRRFYDGGVPGEAPDRTRAPRIVLERLVEADEERFTLRRRLAYDDEEVGELLVPADPEVFRTDLASVPSALTWLVPRTGRHLPAALVHDALVETHLGAPAYVSVRGVDVDRVTADRVFRRAMRDTRTRTVRRWMIWSAVSLATIRAGSSSWSPARHLRLRVAALTSLGLVAVIGVLATLDLLDVVAVLPWMGQRPWWAELLGGAAGAVVVPLLLSLTWGPLRAAGAILGVALALLLHVTAAIVALTLLYRGVERVVSGPQRSA